MGKGYTIKYPRRRVVRGMMRGLTGLLVHRLGELEIVGLEYIPSSGPVILAANHFNFADPPLVLYTSPRMVEFIGGAERPNSPLWSRLIPKAWGFIRAYRGGFSRSTLRQSLEVLEQGGVLGIFPEGGSWAPLLRPARPGLGFIALHSGAPIIPISITGAEDLIGGPKRAVKVQFHPPVAPPNTAANGRARRVELDGFSRDIMEIIASGLPDAQRGMYASDPADRAAALAVSEFPFHAPEMRGM